MSYFYYKFQWIAVIVGFGFLLVSIVYFFDAKHLESLPTSDYVVTGQYCHSYQKQSSLHIKHKEKTYTIWIKRDECENYPVDSQIKLVYHEQYDYFYKPGRLKGAMAKLRVRSVLFLFCLVPFKYFKTRMNRIKK